MSNNKKDILLTFWSNLISTVTLINHFDDKFIFMRHVPYFIKWWTEFNNPIYLLHFLQFQKLNFIFSSFKNTFINKLTFKQIKLTILLIFLISVLGTRTFLQQNLIKSRLILAVWTASASIQINELCSDIPTTSITLTKSQNEVTEISSPHVSWSETPTTNLFNGFYICALLTRLYKYLFFIWCK